MSILERLKKLYLHNCCNCEHLDILPDEPMITRYDCFHPVQEKWAEAPQFFIEPWRENDCEHFQNKKLKKRRNLNGENGRKYDD